MRKKIFSLLKYSLFLGGGILLVWWQFHKMTPEQTTQFKFALANANYHVVPFIVLMSLASHLSRAVRWKILIEPLGYSPSTLNLFGTTMTGYLANSFFPRLGEILKCTLLSRYEKIPFQKLVGTIVVERIFDFVCYMAFTVFTLLIQYKLVSGFIFDSLDKAQTTPGSTPIWVKLLVYLAIFILFLIGLRWLFKKYMHISPIKRIKEFIHGLGEGISSIKKVKKKGWFIFHTFFIWAMYLGQIYLGFSAMQEVSHLGWNAACGILTLATFAMILTPNGLGTFPEAVLLVLTLYNIEETYGKAFGYLMWGTSTLIILIFGSFFLFLMFYLNRKKQPLPESIEPL